MSFNDNSTKQFAVNWNNHMNHVKKAFDNLLNNNEFVDVTLYAEGRKIGAHKILLSACSNYFKNLFQEFPQEHPLVVLKGVQYSVLTDILKFIYNGEVSVDSDVFDMFLQTAEFLQISGLTDTGKKRACKGNLENNGTKPDDDTPVAKKAKQNDFEKECAVKDEPKECAVKDEPKECYSDPESEYAADEPGILTSIFADEISDQERSQFPSEVLQQTATPNTYGIEPIIKHFPQTATGQYECELCGKSYKLKASLSKHLSVHAGYTTCTICAKVLSRKSHLARHMMQTHGMQKSFLNYRKIDTTFDQEAGTS